MKKKKLLVILGAGSSISCGMPSVANIDVLMQSWSKEWENRPTYPKGYLGDGVFNDLWAAVGEYLRENNRSELKIQVNFEKILGEMSALASWTSPSPFGNSLIKSLVDGRISSRFNWRNDTTGPFFYNQLILEQQKYLLERLATHVRTVCKSLDRKSEEFHRYVQIISQLRNEFDVGIDVLPESRPAIAGKFRGLTCSPNLGQPLLENSGVLTCSPNLGQPLLENSGV